MRGRAWQVLTARKGIDEAAARGEPLLDQGLASRLLSACAAASRVDADAAAAREQLRWLLDEMQSAEGRAHEMPSAEGRAHEVESAEGRAHEMPSAEGRAHGKGGRGRRRAPAVEVPRLSTAELLSHPRAQANLLRTLGAAGDFEAARSAFDAIPPPRHSLVWAEMLRVCNACGEAGFASRLLAELDSEGA